MTNRSYSRFQEAGQEALKEKRFQAAKVAFDRALVQASQNATISVSGLITILDLRVETQVKMRDLDGALNDGRSMIRYARDDPRGYLRCGQVSRLKNDLNEAQKWYDRGLRNALKTNHLYSRLEAVRFNVASKIGAGRKNKTQDPFVALPMEIIHMISEHLGLRQATICLRVSTTWRNSLLAIPSIWRTIDLLSARKNVKLSNVKACVRRLSAPPITIRSDKLTPSAVTYLRRYIERWKTIEHLSIHTPDLLNLGTAWTLSTAIKTLHVGSECLVHFSVVDEILHHCDVLQYARFDAISILPFLPTEPSPAMLDARRSMHRKTSLPALTHLVLNAITKFAQGIEVLDGYLKPPAFFHDFPNLTTLQCRGFEISRSNQDLSTARCLRRLCLENSSLDTNFSLPSSLEVLICKACILSLPFVPTPDQEKQPRQTWPRLRILELDGIVQSSASWIEILKSSSATLTMLNLNDCAMETSDLMTVLDSDKLSKLTFLRTSLPGLTDGHMQRIAEGCVCLEYVELLGLGITGVTIKSLCSFTAIKTLKLIKCFEISADAIDWARAKGLQVIVSQMEDTSRFSGRRVRYG